MFKGLLDSNYVKVTQENWKKIEELFSKKENKIKELESNLLNKEEIINIQTLELQGLRKLKEKDDLLYSYELTLEKLKKENEELKNDNIKLKDNLELLNKKLDMSNSLEKTYLEKINEKTSCPKYKTKGDFLLAQYSD